MVPIQSSHLVVFMPGMRVTIPVLVNVIEEQLDERVTLGELLRAVQLSKLSYGQRVS